MADDGFTPEQRIQLAAIWDRLYALYLEQANGDRDGDAIETEIAQLIDERNAIRPWGWNTGQNWKDDIPEEELKRIMAAGRK